MNTFIFVHNIMDLVKVQILLILCAENISFRLVCVTTIGVCIFRCVQLRLYTLFLKEGKYIETKFIITFIH